MPRPVYSAKRQVWRDGGASTGTRQIPEEIALALTYNGGHLCRDDGHPT